MDACITWIPHFSRAAFHAYQLDISGTTEGPKTVSMPFMRLVYHFPMASATSSHRLVQSAGHPWIWFTVALVLTVTGFWPTFFGQLASQTTAHLIHGFTATAWMVAATGQAWLAKRRGYALHRRVGRWLLLLPPIIVLSGLHVVQIMLRRNLEQLDLVRFKFAFLDVGVLALFILFVILAVVSARRRQIAVHAKWMACTAILALEPALERFYIMVIPIVSNFDHALYLSLGTVEALLVVLILREWRARRVWAPYPVLLCFFVTVHALATPVANSSTFQTIAMRLAAT